MTSAKQLIINELWRRGDIASMLLHAGQQQIYDTIKQLPNHQKEIAVCISRRWGKTYLGIVIALEQALSTPNSQVIICAPTQKQASNIIVPLVRQIIETAPDGLITQLKSQLRWKFSNGSMLILGGFDTASESFRGLFSDLIIVEEGSSASADNFEYVIKSILLPTLLSTGGQLIHFFTPALLPDHPIHTDTMVRCELANALFTYDIHSCPLYTPEQIFEMCEAIGGEESTAWKREFLVQITKDSTKLCVPEFESEIHTSPAIKAPEFAKYWISIDFGGVRDMHAAQLYCYDHRANKMLVLDERVYEANTSTAEIVAGINQLKQGLEECEVWADAPGQLRIDLQQQFGLYVRFPLKDEFHASLSVLREGFRLNQIAVDVKCKHLILTLKNATFNSSRTDFLRTIALGHADSLACLIYGWRQRNLNNPFPQQQLDPSKHWQRPDMRKTTSLDAAAAVLNPYKNKHKGFR